MTAYAVIQAKITQWVVEMINEAHFFGRFVFHEAAMFNKINDSGGAANGRIAIQKGFIYSIFN